MKYFLLVYWLFGCFIVGSSMRSDIVACKGDMKIGFAAPEKALIVAVSWPIYIVAITSKYHIIDHTSACWNEKTPPTLP